MHDRLESPYWTLRVGLGGAAFLAGLDKYFGLLADWKGYLSPAVEKALAVDAGAFMAVVGLVEIAVGLAILSGAVRLGAYLAAGWLAAIAANLLLAGSHPDVAVRDVLMAIAAFTLARMEEVRSPSAAGVRAGARAAIDRATA